jgi:anti-sigma-K factor RskA
MELQKIEPLLMDYALGATTPEVSALIEAYQEKDAEVRTRLEQWRGVAQLAQRAIPAEESVTAPIFPRRKLQSARRTMLWRRAAAWGAALAACLMLGYFAGSQRRDRVETVATLGGAKVATLAAAADVPVAAVENFGSQAWWRAVAQQNADRPVRSSSSYSFGNLSVLLQRFGG